MLFELPDEMLLNIFEFLYLNQSQYLNLIFTQKKIYIMKNYLLQHVVNKKRSNYTYSIFETNFKNQNINNTNKVILNLYKFPYLKTLSLQETWNGELPLLNFSFLQKLDLSQTCFPENNLKLLLASLTELYLSYTNITDIGIT